MTENNRYPSQRRCPPELKERAVRLVFERVAETVERQGAITRVARQLGIGSESLRAWVHQAEIDGGARAGLTTEERERIRGCHAVQVVRLCLEPDMAERVPGGIGVRAARSLEEPDTADHVGPFAAEVPR